MRSVFIWPALFLLVVLLFCACTNLNQIIYIESLDEASFISYVPLSNGTLHFKSDEERLNDLTPQDLTDNAPEASDFHRGQVKQPADQLKGVRNLNEDEAMRLLNLEPSRWVIPKDCTINPNYQPYHSPTFYVQPDGDYDYADFYIFLFSYSNVATDRKLEVYISAAPVKWSVKTSLDYLMPQFVSIRTFYGELDSRVGDIPLAVIANDGRYRAHFVLGNTAYEVFANNLSQREFSEFLISACQTPQGENKNVIEYLLSE